MKSLTRLSLVAVLLSFPVLSNRASARNDPTVRLAPPDARAAEQPGTFGLYPRHRTYSISGTVRGVWPRRGVITIRDDSGFDATIVIPRDVPVMRHGHRIGLGALRVGTHVAGWAKRPAEHYIASSLRVQ